MSFVDVKLEWIFGRLLDILCRVSGQSNFFFARWALRAFIVLLEVAAILLCLYPPQQPVLMRLVGLVLTCWAVHEYGLVEAWLDKAERQQEDDSAGTAVQELWGHGRVIYLLIGLVTLLVAPFAMSWSGSVTCLVFTASLFTLVAAEYFGSQPYGGQKSPLRKAKEWLAAQLKPAQPVTQLN